MIRCLVWSMVILFSFSVNPLQAEEADKFYIRQAIALAASAIEQGNHPFGAVLVRDGKVVSRASNTVKTENSFVHHAEINALAAAFRKQGPESVRGATLYTSCEPCAMCSGAIFMGGINRVVYGLSADRLSAITGFSKVFPSRKFFRLTGADIEVIGPVLEEDAAEVVRKYMHLLRKQAAKTR